MRTWTILGTMAVFCIGFKEYWDGPCKVKLEAKRDEFKEEVKCE
jgi:hypothetical protein